MSSKEASDTLIHWLQVAWQMEEESLSMLTRLCHRLTHYPLLEERLEKHLEETVEQKNLLAGCLERLQAEPPRLGQWSAGIAAWAKNVAATAADDEVVRSLADCYIFEQQEIVHYIVIIEAARELGDQHTLGIAEMILRQEISMANWLLDHAPQVTRAFLSREAANPATAKR